MIATIEARTKICPSFMANFVHGKWTLLELSLMSDDYFFTFWLASKDKFSMYQASTKTFPCVNFFDLKVRRWLSQTVIYAKQVPLSYKVLLFEVCRACIVCIRKLSYYFVVVSSDDLKNDPSELYMIRQTSCQFLTFITFLFRRKAETEHRDRRIDRYRYGSNL